MLGSEIPFPERTHSFPLEEIYALLFLQWALLENRNSLSPVEVSIWAVPLGPKNNLLLYKSPLALISPEAVILPTTLVLPVISTLPVKSWKSSIVSPNLVEPLEYIIDDVSYNVSK